MTFSDTCCVCGGPLEGQNTSSCANCGGRFHQPWSVEAPTPTCGRIFPHPDAMGLVFLCLPCASSLDLAPLEGQRTRK